MMVVMVVMRAWGISIVVAVTRCGRLNQNQCHKSWI
jgi:hypothetical protein